jgi:teichuronic acid biosynthesis glycosyltransferase TuaC
VSEKIKCLFVSSAKKNKQPNPIIQSQAFFIQMQGIEIEHFIVIHKGFNGYFRECLKLRKYLKNKKIDIIHAHYGFSGIISLIARRKEKLVVSFMGDDIIGSNRKNGSITATSSLIARLNAFLSFWFYDYTIVKSREMKERLKSKKSIIIPNGVDTNAFYPTNGIVARKKLNLKTTEKIALFVSNHKRVEKNFNLAQQAVALCKIHSLNILQISDIPQLKLVDYYNAADLLLLTSFHEGSPNVIKEALACNCPIVSTKVGDVEWLIGETRGCYLSSFKPENFAEKIKLALEFKETEKFTNGRNRIIELGLEAETIAKRIVTIYRKIILGN